ncbi:MAG: beta-ketoacyl-[acyl-carrier-protein] synthase family protein [Nitrospirae bacterium]|nr:beta-ketoacyl-[acyl-carrier-protein] synthase family protein [Nitrospirota bacterium]
MLRSWRECAGKIAGGLPGLCCNDSFDSAIDKQRPERLKHNDKRVVITGYGAFTPIGRSAVETFENAARGVSGIREITSFDTRGLPTTIGGECPPAWYDELRARLAASHIRFGTRVERFATRAAVMMLGAAEEAVSMAFVHGGNQFDALRIGVAIGNHGETPPVEDMVFLHRFYDGKRGWDVPALMKAGGYDFFNFMRRKGDVAAAITGAAFGSGGPNVSVSSACAAGAQAIGEASALIRDGVADAMIAGGCESTLNFSGFVSFVLIKALVEKYTSPSAASRPFDRKRGGFVMSEGAGAVVIEELYHALKRNATIYGEILGYGSSADAYRITDTHPKGEGAIIAMKSAIEDAGLTTGEVDYVNAHGTSTIQNDATETLAIKAVFGDKSKSLPVSSNKSMIGHTIAAAGAIECVLSTMGINRSVVLPTINYENPDPRCDLDYVPNVARTMEHRVVLSNSFGFGGQNACLCIGKFQE